MKNTGTLKVTLPTDREVLLTRVFDAPRRLVFQALTTPDLAKPDRMVHTESFDDFPGSESVVTTLLTESGGKTTLNATILSPSREVRDAVIQSGMEHGAAETYDRMAELLATMV